MAGGGTRAFLEPDHYEASLRQAQIKAVLVPNGKFEARLTWAELHDLQALRCEEDFPHVAYIQLDRQLAFVTFPAGSGALPVWRGRQVQTGDLMFHSRGERLHQSWAAAVLIRRCGPKPAARLDPVPPACVQRSRDP